MDSAIASTAIAATVDDSAAPPFGLVDLFRAVNDPTRLRILLLLRRFELAIGELAILLDQSQPRVSRHVRLLEEAGLAERRKEGSWVFVRLMRGERIDALFGLIDAVAMSSVEGRFARQDSARLQAVRAEREAAATRYFANHASEWDAIRSLHVAEEEVERAILAIMRNRRLGHLLDIGTGTGRMAAILGPTASRVSTLDRSPEMLRIARAHLADTLPHAEFLAGDFLSLPFAEGSVDTVVMHQVLHFAATPGAVITEASRVLVPSGHLLIVDFAPHDREDLRRDAAHVRLGFSDGQIRGWFASAGIITELTEALSGGELTVKIWLGRRRSDANPPRRAT